MEPPIPPPKVRSQGGGTQDTPDETLCAAIVYVLVSGCVWRALPPCFGISKSTAHRRFLIWSSAGVWGRLHEAVLHRLDDAGLIDVSRVVLDSAHVRAKIERTVSWLIGCRRLSHRYERPSRTYLAFPGLAAALCGYKRLLRLTA